MTTPSRTFLVGLIGLACALPARATYVPTEIPNPDPEIERKSFKIADGFEIHLFASDPMIEKPIQMNWDGRGRLWCATSQTYPQLVPGQTPNDKIVILEDTTTSGKADKSTVFADGLFMPNSVVPGDGGAYVTNSTEILHLKDTKGTGKADQRHVVLAGFGTEDTHHIVHTLHWGPDGRLYFLQSIYIHSHLETPHGLKTLLGSGVWRFDTRTLDLNVYSHGLVNPWGIVWDRWGQTFETDGAGGEGINYAFPGVGFTSAVGYEKVMAGLNPGSPKYASEVILSASTIPDDYQGDILTNDFRANRIVRFKVSDNGAGFTSKQMSDFLTSTDPAFRPVDLSMGPDGAIYIADWYNPIIQHGEVDFRDPRRDHTHGRIWRVTVKGAAPLQQPKIEGASIAELLDLLKSSEDWTRAQAKLALRDRKPADVLPVLKAWVERIHSNTSQADHDRLEALWTCENLNAVEPELLGRVMRARDYRVRAAAVRVAGDWAGQLSDPLQLIAPMVNDESPRVRLEAIRALANIPSPQSVVAATKALDKPTDPFIDYALWLTCTELEPIWLPAYQSGSLTDWEKPEHLGFALRAVKSRAAVSDLLSLLTDMKTPAETRAGIVQLLGSIGEPADANTILNQAVSPLTGVARTGLLAALVRMAEDRNIRPTQQPDRIAPLLSDPLPATAAQAIVLVGDWKLESLRPEVEKIAENTASDTSPRLYSIAMLTLGRLGGEQSRQRLDKLSEPSQRPDVREAAIGGLVLIDVNQAAQKAADLLAADQGDPSALIPAFSSREGGTRALVEALKRVKLPADVARVALRTVRSLSSQDPALTQAFSSAAGIFGAPIKLTAGQMKQMVDEVLAKGDAARGEQVFRRAESSCYLCHAIDGAGGWLAPDLSSIGASSPVDYLINSVLDPNKDIKDGFDGYSVVTKSGDAYSGIKVGQDNAHITLRDNAHYEIPIPLSEIKEQKSIGSLMPNGLSDTMTHEEFLDLIKFLSQLGKPGPYASSPAQYIRRWRVPPPELASQSPSEQTVASLDGGDWPPAYSLVSGFLPGDAIRPHGTGIGYVRGQINVTAAGKIGLAPNDSKGLTLWVDGKPVQVGPEITIDQPAGVHTLTFGVDPTLQREGLRIEVLDLPGSSAHAQPVGGK